MPYFPSKAPPTESPDGQALAAYLEDELQRLASSIVDDVQAVEIRPAHTVPLRPREGTLVYADGTDWNPGKGEGTYTYGSDAAWHLLENKTISLTADVSGILPVANGGTGDSGTAWTAFTPVVTATAGTFTTATATMRYKTIGKTLFFSGVLTITTVGTASGYPLMTLPVAAQAAGGIVAIGREGAVTGKTVVGFLPGASSLELIYYDNSSPIVAGSSFPFSGRYETA